MQHLLYEVPEPHIALITLNRPEVLNALNGRLRREFDEAVHRAAEDPEVRAIVVTGAGSSFCAGVDVKEWAAGGRPMGEATSDDDRPPPYTNEHGTSDVIKPMVAAVRGYCLGGGLNLIMARCDIRVAGENARFGMPEVVHGIIDLTTPFAIEGLSRAFLSELLFTAEPVSAQRALEAGLVNAVVPDDEVLPAAMRYAVSIARHSPTAVQATKLNLLKTFEATAEAHEWERRLRDHTFDSPEALERMRAFSERPRTHE